MLSCKIGFSILGCFITICCTTYCCVIGKVLAATFKPRQPYVAPPEEDMMMEDKKEDEDMEMAMMMDTDDNFNRMEGEPMMMEAN